jgi:transcription termination factor Rho
MDEVIFEELKGAGNMELRLRGDLAEQRIFPAIDPVQSSTRSEDQLVNEEELAVVWKLRQALAKLEGTQAPELLLKRLRKTQTNYEFLRQVQQKTPTVND